MKKILAIVLALVMTMSMATISSGAAFSDAGDVQYVDAVNTLNALGVLNGYADGSIKPQGDVTRGAAAKMVAMVATGSNTTTLGYYAGTSAFADVPATHVFADAVAFCVARGIVAGYGDGNYGLSDNVKGWAVAKMALVAMGYDAEAYGMEGTGSALNTITLASNVGLFAGMKADFVATEAASREECAQIVYNALSIQGVKVKETTNTGVVTFEDSGKCLLNNYVSSLGAGLDTYAEVAAFDDALEAIESVASVVIEVNQATSTGAYTYDTADTRYNVETGLDLIGHEVLMVKNGGGYDAVDGLWYDNVFAVVDMSKVVTVAYEAIDTEAEFDAAFGKAAVTYSNSTCNDFNNYNEGATLTPSFTDGSYAAVGTYVLDADNNVVSYLTTSFDVGSVTKYNAGTAKANGAVAVGGDAAESWVLHTKSEDTTPDEVKLYDGIAKDDIVVIQDTGDITTLTKAATVTGKLTAVDKTNYIVTIGGAPYYVSAAFVGAGEGAELGLDAADTYAYDGAVAKDVLAYLDNDGSVFAIVDAPEATNDNGLVYLVTDYTLTTNTAYGTAPAYYIQCVDMEGNEVSYQIETANAYDSHLGDLRKVSTYVKDGVTYASFTSTVTNASIVDDQTTDIAATAVKLGGNNYFASDVKFIFVSGSEADLYVTTKTGVQPVDAGDLDGDSVVDVTYEYYMATGANNTIKYVVVNGYESSTVLSTDVVYCSAANATSAKAGTYLTADGVTYDESAIYNVYINGVLTEVAVDADGVDVAPVEGFNSYTKDAITGLYDFAAYSTNCENDGTVTNVYNNMLTVNFTVEDLTDVAVAADAVVVDVWYNELSEADKKNATEITSADELLNCVVAAVWEDDATTAPESIVTIYVLEHAHEDGLLVDASATYLKDVVGIDAGDVAAIVANPDWVVIQYTRTEGNKGELTIKDANDNVVYEEDSTLTTAGIKAFWVDPAGANAGDPSTLALTAGTYTFEVVVDGIVAAAGSFVVA